MSAFQCTLTHLGAIVGTYPDEKTFKKIAGALEPLGVKVFKPTIK